MRNIIFLCVLSASTLFGCSSTSTENVTSEGISADIDIETYGNGVTVVEVDLNVGSGLGGTNLELGASDRLSASSNGQTKRLVEDSNLFKVNYITEFDFDSAGTEFRVSLIRENGLSAENSIASLPNAFDITLPVGTPTYGRNEVMNFGWTPGEPSGNNMLIEFERECRSGDNSFSGFEARETSDNGSFAINASELLSSGENGLDDSGGCDVTATFTRFNRGELDPNYGEGGSIEGKQKREVRFTIAGE